jgi:hypothetical protein
MAWIESHQELRQHPKVIKTARALGVSKAAMIGHLHCLWWWALDYAQDGNLSAFDAADIAEAADWEGDAQVFVDALFVSARIGNKPGLLEIIDGDLCIHDWWDYAGKLIDKRKTDAERKRQGRRKDSPETSGGHPMDGTKTSSGSPMSVAGTVQYSTEPNSTEPNSTEPTEPKEEEPRRARQATATAFEAFMQARGGAVNSMDSEQLGELEALYGSETMVRAINYCNQHRKQSFLSVGYIAKTLAGWQKDSGVSENRSNGSGPKTFKVDFGGVVEEREA